MFTQSDVQILVGQLPDKAVAKISKRTKISKPTIYKFFKGGKVDSDKAQKIYSAGLALIKSNVSREQLLRKKSSQLLKTNSCKI